MPLRELRLAAGKDARTEKQCAGFVLTDRSIASEHVRDRTRRRNDLPKRFGIQHDRVVGWPHQLVFADLYSAILRNATHQQISANVVLVVPTLTPDSPPNGLRLAASVNSTIWPCPIALSKYILGPPSRSDPLE